MKRIKISLVAPPFSGHLNPVIGLARELVEIAEVTVISTPSATRAIEAAGLKAFPILANGEKIVLEIASPGSAVKGSPLGLYRQLKANVSLQVEMLAALDAAFRETEPDLVIADFTLPVAATAAGRCGACWWTALPSPCVFETPDGPPAYFGGKRPARSLLENWGHFFLRKLTRLFKRTMFFVFRRTFREVGLQSIYRDDGSERGYSSECILATSIRELEFPRGYPAQFHFIGPSLYTPPGTEDGPQFEDGKKHVLVTLGSHLGHLKDGMAQRIREISRNSGVVFHFSDGEASRARAVTGDGNFQRHSFISYDRFLERYDLVIHHGGSGILLNCLKRGIPAIVLPLDFDQFDNAARLEAAGAAIWIRDPSEITGAVEMALQNPVLRARAREFAGIVASYNSGAALRELVGRLAVELQAGISRD